MDNNNDKMAQHARVNDRPAEEYLMAGGDGFKWDKGRWGEGGKVTEVVGALSRVSRDWNFWHGIWNCDK